MSELSDLSSARVAILGLGLMGGSLALALNGRCSETFGIDIHPGTLDLALRNSVVNRASTDPRELIPEADVIILAAPVGAILEFIQQLPGLHPGNALVMDIGSTKMQICQVLAELPARFDPVGGHPMCGKESSGIANAEAGLFKGATFALCCLPQTSPQARRLAEEIVRAVGAYAFWMEPQEHDRWTAATSHAPYLLSAALALATPQEAAPMVGPGFRSSSRLAASSPMMMLDILSSNRQNVLTALRAVQEQLDGIERLLEVGDQAALVKLLTQAKAARQSLLQAVESESGERA